MAQDRRYDERRGFESRNVLAIVAGVAAILSGIVMLYEGFKTT